jgi:hypothetical protein
MAADIIDPSRVRELFDYNPETGRILWKSKPCRRIVPGTIAGRIDGHGYWQIRFNKRSYQAHRIAWAHVHGVWPKADIDHINGIRADNRLCNLRDVPRSVNSENQRKARRDNKSTGVLGVTVHKPTGLFVAFITVAKRQRNLGYFKTLDEASQAYLKAKRELHVGCTI